ncbi:hypothetical protein [Prosthecobacter sp.]|uniref:hypothetical protein n=1 Tax=Prosthecobacter sp. TaxID=1965333 RepID=UPI00378501D9
MKTHALISAAAAALASAMALGSCTNPAILKLRTPAVQAQIIGAVEKDILAGGGALLISGGSTGAAVAAMSAQELRNIPALQQVLSAQVSAKSPAAGVAP